MNSEKLYGIRKCGVAHGDVFTHPSVVSYMLDLVGYTANRDLSHITILEPACGEGEFLLEILTRLSLSAKTFRFDANKAACENVFAYEVDDSKIKTAVGRIESLGLGYSRAGEMINNGDFLKESPPQVDIVVGNPPYVRYEQLSADIIKFCRHEFPTFHYRADLYVPFYEKTLKLLKPNGKHCFICSNRWLKNEYGRKLRRLISSSFCLELIADMEQAKPFMEQVAAYVDIVLISRAQRKRSFRFFEIDDIKKLGVYHKEEQLPCPADDDWLSSFNRAQGRQGLYSIEDLGLKIGIGVATGADKVFISEHLAGQIEKNLLIPVVKGKDLRGNALKWSGAYLLNPYNDNGTLIELRKYPKAEAYLLHHEEKLKSRHVARKNPNCWYRTIDRVYPQLQYQPKILLPDMSANTFLVVDEGAFYPSHNLYYITGTDSYHLKLLSAILASDFVCRQLASITTKMSGGYTRWQSQYLHRLRVPDIFHLDEEDSESLLASYEKLSVVGINWTLERILSRQAYTCVRGKGNTVQLALPF